MRGRYAIFAALVAVAVAVALLLTLGAGGSAEEGDEIPGQPAIEVVSPRNGARHKGRAVVVRIKVRNFRLAPERFGKPPQLGEGHIRFALNRVPDCVDPAKLQRALESARGTGRLIGRSFDFPRYAGPNGILAERIGVGGLYSPATRPEIYYQDLPPGFYRIVITLAQNDGSTTPFHAVRNFEILPGEHSDGLPECPEGKVSSAEAAKATR